MQPPHEDFQLSVAGNARRIRRCFEMLVKERVDTPGFSLQYILGQ